MKKSDFKEHMENLAEKLGYKNADELLKKYRKNVVSSKLTLEEVEEIIAEVEEFIAEMEAIE